jgi:hypothetical protein
MIFLDPSAFPTSQPDPDDCSVLPSPSVPQSRASTLHGSWFMRLPVMRDQKHDLREVVRLARRRQHRRREASRQRDLMSDWETCDEWKRIAWQTGCRLRTVRDSIYNFSLHLTSVETCIRKNCPNVATLHFQIRVISRIRVWKLVNPRLWGWKSKFWIIEQEGTHHSADRAWYL